MSDQCRNCTLEGDIDKCLSVECSVRENWCARTLAQKLSALEQENKRLNETIAADKDLIQQYQQEAEELRVENEDLSKPAITGTNITEIIPSDLPDWAKESFKTGQFFRVAVDKVAELEALIKEASDYLDTNELTSIGNTSILHQKFKEAISAE